MEGAFNFDLFRIAANLPEEFSFGIDWTVGGAGQDVLRNIIREMSTAHVRHLGREFVGVFKFEWGTNTNDGKVFFKVVPMPKA